MNELNIKYLQNTLLVCIVLLTLAIVYICAFGVYSDITRPKLYTIDVAQCLMIPLTAFLGALFGIMMNKDKKEKKE